MRNRNVVQPRGEAIDALSTEHLHADLKGRSVRGGALSVAAQVSQVLLQTISAVVLARLLMPSDFGLVAMVTGITAIAVGFADLGLTEATIQRKEISHDQVSTLFWINVGIGLLLTLLTAAAAPLLAKFYREPKLVGITLVISLSFLLGGLRSQHNALLKRQMRFSSIAIRDVTAYAVGVAVGVAMAWRGAGYWALVTYPLVTSFTQMVISWSMVKWMPGLPRLDSEVRSFVHFGGYVAASYAVFNWLRNVDNVLIGWYWGASPLGLYSRGFNLLVLALSQITGPTSNVAIPAFSRIQGDRELFSRYYLRIMNLIAWISAALFGFLFVAAEPFIVLVLGEKWRAAAPVFQILTLSALGQLLLESTLWVLISRGQSARLFKLMLLIAPFIIAGIAVGLPFGIKRVALSLSLTLLAIIPWVLIIAFRGTDLTLQALGRALLCPISLCLAGVCSAKLALYLAPAEHTVLQLLELGVAFAIPYGLSIMLPPVRKEMLSFWNLLGEFRLFRGRFTGKQKASA
jgi:O-antigen/teichoic acid export membrane protein